MPVLSDSQFLLNLKAVVFRKQKPKTFMRSPRLVHYNPEAPGLSILSRLSTFYLHVINHLHIFSSQKKALECHVKSPELSSWVEIFYSIPALYSSNLRRINSLRFSSSFGIKRSCRPGINSALITITSSFCLYSIFS